MVVPKIRFYTTGYHKYHQVEVVIDTNLILIYTFYTSSICNNRQLLQYVKTIKIDDVIHIVINGRSQKYEMMGRFKIILIFAHYNLDSLTNTHSFKYVASITGAQVEMDIEIEGVIVSHHIN